MDLPKISIVTPSYNQRRFLAWTMRSVLLQRYPNLEYIVMDGGSTDGSAEYIASVGDRLAHWQSAPDGGQAAAVRAGLDRSTGEICAWLNSDDMLAPGALQFVAEYFRRNPEVDMVYSNRVFVDENNRVGSYWILPEHSDYLMMHWDLIPQETAFWRRSLMDRVGGVDPSYRFALDYDLFVRFMKQGRLARAKRFLGAFRLHGDSKTQSQINTIGAQEIYRVRTTHGITFGRKAHFRGFKFSKSVELRSIVWSRTGRTMPGSLPGIGWNYGDLWGGLLDAEGFPAPARAEAAEAREPALAG